MDLLKNGGRGWRRFLVLITPSLIHLLFLVALAGHAASCLFSERFQMPLDGNEAKVLPDGTGLTVTAHSCRNYPAGTLMANRIEQCTADMEILMKGGAVEKKRLAFLESVEAGRYSIFLDMRKDPSRRGMRERKPDPIDLTCNKAHLYKVTPKKVQGPSLYLVALTDPGFPVIVVSCVAIVVLLLWYFGNSPSLRT